MDINKLIEYSQRNPESDIAQEVALYLESDDFSIPEPDAFQKRINNIDALIKGTISAERRTALANKRGELTRLARRFGDTTPGSPNTAARRMALVRYNRMQEGRSSKRGKDDGPQYDSRTHTTVAKKGITDILKKDDGLGGRVYDPAKIALGVGGTALAGYALYRHFKGKKEKEEAKKEDRNRMLQMMALSASENNNYGEENMNKTISDVFVGNDGIAIAGSGAAEALAITLGDYAEYADNEQVVSTAVDALRAAQLTKINNVAEFAENDTVDLESIEYSVGDTVVVTPELSGRIVEIMPVPASFSDPTMNYQVLLDNGALCNVTESGNLWVEMSEDGSIITTPICKYSAISFGEGATFSTYDLGLIDPHHKDLANFSLQEYLPQELTNFSTEEVQKDPMGVFFAECDGVEHDQENNIVYASYQGNLLAFNDNDGIIYVQGETGEWQVFSSYTDFQDWIPERVNGMYTTPDGRTFTDKNNAIAGHAQSQQLANMGVTYNPESRTWNYPGATGSGYSDPNNALNSATTFYGTDAGREHLMNTPWAQQRQQMQQNGGQNTATGGTGQNPSIQQSGSGSAPSHMQMVTDAHRERVNAARANPNNTTTITNPDGSTTQLTQAQTGSNYSEHQSETYMIGYNIAQQGNFSDAELISYARTNNFNLNEFISGYNHGKGVTEQTFSQVEQPKQIEAPAVNFSAETYNTSLDDIASWGSDMSI